MNYQHIIVPVDGSEISLAAARQAAHIAKAFGSINLQRLVLLQ